MRRIGLLAACAGLLGASAGLAVAGWHARGSPPPQPPAARASGPDSGGRAAAAGPGPLARSLPVHVAIPAIGVRARIIPLGEEPGGTVAVPSLATPFLTSWFDEGPTPGQRGQAALFGHVDSAASGPAVFYQLGDLRPGDTARVRLADRATAVFRIYRVATYVKADFPTRLVYGPTETPELRLITCGGPFDEAAGSYLDNVVAFARLAAVRRA